MNTTTKTTIAGTTAMGKFVMADGKVARIDSRSGGWTTLRFADSTVKKVRNSTPLDFPPVADDLPEDKEKVYSIDVLAKARAAYKAAGRSDCGDPIAETLRGKPLEEVYALAAGPLGMTVGDLKAMYSHLNPGMQRMNLGNKLRRDVGVDEFAEYMGFGDEDEDEGGDE
jgi:hypothetical protein